MLAEVCPERSHKDSKHEWVPYRWVKEPSAGGYSVQANTVMKLGEVMCKYCLEKKVV